jgi:hypothetical protein
MAQSFVLNGKVTDRTNGKAIEYASLLNYTKGNRVYANSAGDFRLEAEEGDTLVLFALGYYYRKVMVNDFLRELKLPEGFGLTPQAYVIPEVQIMPEVTYNDFKNQFLSLDHPKTAMEKLQETLKKISLEEGPKAYQQEVARRRSASNEVVLVSVPILTPEEKERIKLGKIIRKEEIQDAIYHKFNPARVKVVTGLADDDSLIEFMNFCDFPDAWLLKVNDYDLMEAIARRYETFVTKKQLEKTIQNSLEYTCLNFCQI